MIKMEMSTTSSDIYNLIIQTSSWTVGGKLGKAGKTISTTASYNQWTTFVFKIHM